MGDERERDVILRAYTFGAVLSTYVLFTLGVLFAVVAAGHWTGLLTFGSGVIGAAIGSIGATVAITISHRRKLKQARLGAKAMADIEDVD